MHTTYVIESLDDYNLVDIFTRLGDAKSRLQFLDSNAWNMEDCKFRILCLKGLYKFEGRHAYEVKYFGNVFLKSKF